MECKLVLFSILVLYFDLVVCYSQVEDEYKLGVNQLAERSKTVQRHQRPQNVNHGSYRPRGGNLPQGFQEAPSGQRQRSHIFPQQKHSNYVKPQIANNIPQNFYQETQNQVPYDQRSPRQLYNNYGRPQNVYNAPQGFEEITPEVPPQERKITQQETMSSRQNINNVPSEGPWSGQRLLPQNEGFERPYTPNNFPNNYPESYVDRRRNYGNYQNGYPQYQMPTPIISNPAEDYNNYRQEWPQQNQYHHMSIPSPGRYPQWPETGYPNSPPMGPQYMEPIIQNEYNEPAYPVYPPILDNGSAMNVGPVPDLTEPVYQNGQTQTVPSQQSAKDYSKSHKRYIIVHANGTHEHVDNLAGIVVDDFNVTHIEPNDIPTHILAIIEVEDNISDVENEKNVELPFDTGISKIPQDTNWNSNYQDYPGTSQTYTNPDALRTEQHKHVPNIHTTTEDTDMDYFKPEYIMPIQSTTENSIDNTTDTALTTTESNENVEESTNNFDNLYTPQKTDIPKCVQNGTYGDLSCNDKDTSNVTEPSVEGPTSFENDNPMYYVPGTMPLEAIASPFSETRIETDGYSTLIPYGDDYLINEANDQAFISPSTYTYDLPRDSEIEKVTDDVIQGETTSYPAGDQNVTDATTSTEGSGDNTPDTRESDKLRDDLKTAYAIPDLAELKTIVDKPVVWFRPDKNFWDKVAKGEQSYDVVSIYDIRCEPRLVERHTTVHHYPNGTEIIDYSETLWDHAGDLNPKEIKSNRVVRHPNN